MLLASVHSSSELLVSSGKRKFNSVVPSDLGILARIESKADKLFSLSYLNDDSRGNFHTIVDCFIHLITVAGVAISVVGGVNLESTDPSTYNSSLKKMKAGSLVLLLSFILIAIYAIITFWKVHRASARSASAAYARRLGIALCVSIPFLAVRAGYGVHLIFNPSILLNGGQLGVKIGCDTIMQVICVLIYIIAGFLTFPIERSRVASNGYEFNERVPVFQKPQ